MNAAGSERAARAGGAGGSGVRMHAPGRTGRNGRVPTVAVRIPVRDTRDVARSRVASEKEGRTKKSEVRRVHPRRFLQLQPSLIVPRFAAADRRQSSFATVIGEAGTDLHLLRTHREARIGGPLQDGPLRSRRPAFAGDLEVAPPLTACNVSIRDLLPLATLVATPQALPLRLASPIIHPWTRKLRRRNPDPTGRRRRIPCLSDPGSRILAAPRIPIRKGPATAFDCPC